MLVSDKTVKRRISLTLTRVYVEALDHLVEEGIYMEPQVAIRAAMRRLFQFHGIEPFSEKAAELEIEKVAELEIEKVAELEIEKVAELDK